MIHITYHQRIHSLEIQGHAQYGEMGKDIVCAAVSALFDTLAANARDMKQAGGVVHLETVEEDGIGKIYCKAATRYENLVRLMFDMICKGLELVALEYPDFVAYELVEG